MCSCHRAGMPDTPPERSPGRAEPRKQGSRRRKTPPWAIPDPNVNEDGTPVVLTEAQTEKKTAQAKRVVVWWLGNQACTRSQLAEKLRRKGIPDVVANPVLDEYERLGYINDRAYAESKARTAVDYSRHGASRVRRALREKGVPEDVVEDVVADTVTPARELENARALVTKKMATSSMRGLPRQKVMNRLTGMLARRGYPPNVAFQVAREAWDTANSDSDEDGYDLEGGW